MPRMMSGETRPINIVSNHNDRTTTTTTTLVDDDDSNQILNCDSDMIMNRNSRDLEIDANSNFNSDKISNNSHKANDSDVQSIAPSSFQSKCSLDEFQPSKWNLEAFLLECASRGTMFDIFIMSEAGKPIYCYSRREDTITLMGVCVALVNYVIKTQSEQLRTITTRNGLHIHFSVHSPLIIVVVFHRNSNSFDEQTLINQIHAQLISTITLKKLESIFRQAPTYNLKKIIHKNDFKTLGILIKSIIDPVTNGFMTFRSRKLVKGQRQQTTFNNVLSFYTSMASLSTSRSLTNQSNKNSLQSNQSLTHYMNDQKHIHHYKNRNNLGRIYVPVAVMNPNLREQITLIINQSVVSSNDLVFSLLFLLEDNENDIINETIPLSKSSSSFSSGSLKPNFPTLISSVSSSSSTNASDNESNDIFESFESAETSRKEILSNTNIENNCWWLESSTSQSVESSSPPIKDIKLITVCNHTTKYRLGPPDIQLLLSLIKASDSLISSTESLWLPICLGRVDADRFLHAHISFLNKKYCLILLDADHNNFEKCRQVKDSIQFKLDQIRTTEPMFGLRSNISELNQPNLQYLCYQTPRHCAVWQASSQNEFSLLNYSLIDRMQRSSFKTLWLRSTRAQCALLGWQTATFQLYIQFDSFVTKQIALETVQSFIKWIKKEEDKLIIKDT